MLKPLAILALLLFILPPKTHTQPQNTQQEQSREKPTLPATPVGIENANRQGFEAEYKHHVEADVRVISTPQKDGYDKASFWASMALVLVGFAGICVAVCTLKKIERQTKATEDSAAAALRSIKLQELQNRQRVSIEDVGIGLSYIPANARTASITAEYDVGNPTQMVLTLTRTTLSTNIRCEPLDVRFEHPISPEDTHQVRLQIPIEGEVLDKLRAFTLELIMDMTVEFIDASGERYMQHFKRSGWCGDNGTMRDIKSLESSQPRKL